MANHSSISAWEIPWVCGATKRWTWLCDLAQTHGGNRREQTRTIFRKQEPRIRMWNLLHFDPGQTKWERPLSFLTWEWGGSEETSWCLLFSCQVVSDSLHSHGLQHARPFCPSPSPRVCPSSHALSQWCHPAISSSVIPFSSCPQSFPASGSFPMSWLFASGGWSIGASASASVLLMSIQDVFL